MVSGATSADTAPPLALRFISGKYQGGEFPLPASGEVVIGRSSELEVVLVEDMVSRRHAKITVEKKGVFLEDLGSTNGSFVNGERIEKTELHEGDRVLIGTSIIKIVASDGAAPIEAAKEQVQQQAASPHQTSLVKTITGSIAEVPLPDLLQLFGASKKSGVLVVRTDRDEGRIYLKDGSISYAVVNGDESVAPEKAFYRILVWDAGTFDMMGPEEREFPSEINMSNEGLLMEGMRQLDEIRRLGDDLPPLQAPLVLSKPMEASLGEATPEELEVVQLAHNYGSVVGVMNHSGKADNEVAEIIVSAIKKGYLSSN